MTASTLRSPREPLASTRVMIALFASFSLLTVLGGAYWYRHSATDIEQRARHELVTTSNLKATELTQWRMERLGDAEILRRNGTMFGAIEHYGTDPDGELALRRLSTLLRSYEVYRQYDRAYLVNRRGDVLLSEPAPSAPLGETLAHEAATALRYGQTRLVDFYLDDQDGRPHMALLVPILEASNTGHPVAMIVLRIDPQVFLYPYLANWPGASTTAETLLVRRDGDDALFLNDLRYRHDAAVRLRIPLAEDRVLAVQSLLGRDGAVGGVDYSGAPAIGVVRAMPDTTWHLITRMHRSEIDAATRSRGMAIAAFTTLLLFCLGASVTLVWRGQRARFYRTRAEWSDAMRDNEERLRLAMHAASMGLWDFDVPSGAVVVSPEYALMLGHDPDDFHENAAGWEARVHPDDRPEAKRVLGEFLEKQPETYTSEFRLRTRDGGYRWIHSVGRIISRTPDGKVQRMIGLHSDVTTRKEAELRSVRMTRLYAALSQCNEAIVRSPDTATLFPKVCHAAVEHGGMSMAWIGMVNEATGTVEVAASHGESIAYLDDIVVTVNPDDPHGQGPTGTCIYENAPFWNTDDKTSAVSRPWQARGEKFGWVASAALPLTRDGRPVGALTLYAHTADVFDAEGRALLTEMSTDISFALSHFAQRAQREASERALRESQERYRALYEDNLVPMVLIDPETTAILDLNDAAARFYGWDGAKLKTMTIAELNVRGNPWVHERLMLTLEEVRSHLEVQHRVASGEVRDIEVFSNRVEIDGKALVLANVIDITARKRTEAELIEKEHILAESQRLAAIGSFTIDAKGVSRWSDELFRLYGLPIRPTPPTPAESATFIHPEDVPMVSSGREVVYRDGAGVGEFRIVRPDGSVRYVAGRAERRADSRGNPTLVGTVQDITDRKEAEAALRASLREKEALLKEVHHRVKNNLQVISSLLRLEGGRTQERAVKAVLGEMQNRVLSMALLHETLYRSGDLAGVNLGTYLAQLAQQIFRALHTTSGAVTLKLDMDSARVELDQAVPCGLLITELISNCFKHGFPGGQQGEVRVMLRTDTGTGSVTLVVQDNGVGLPDDLDARKGRSLGLQLVSDLARQLHGTLTITPTPGATFSMQFTPRMPARDVGL